MGKDTLGEITMSWKKILKSNLRGDFSDFFGFIEQQHTTSVIDDRRKLEKILKNIKKNLGSLKTVMETPHYLYNSVENGKARILSRIERIEEEYKKKEPDYDDIGLFLEDLKDSIHHIMVLEGRLQ